MQDNYCNPMRTSSLQAFTAGRYQVHNNAGVSTVNFTYNTETGRLVTAPYWDYNGRLEIGQARHGGTLSVFAGTYGVTIKRDSDGESSDQYGITVPGPDNASDVTTLQIR
jgi:hypothetical protein